MESLECKLDRLSPEQRKEAEDFVDFLLSRSGQAYRPPGNFDAPLAVLNNAPPLLPVSRIESVHVAETRPVLVQDPANADNRAVPVIPGDAARVPFQEIDGGIPGWITHDYMDYGQFEQQPSPATEAVRKVKRRLVAKEGQDKSHNLLDWVD